jgi:hypothetical protein
LVRSTSKSNLILFFFSLLRISYFWVVCLSSDKNICLFGLGVPSHWHSIGHIATFQLYWCRKISGALPCIISGTNGHLSRTTDVPLASWIASSHERIQSPCRNSNPQPWGASGLKSTTLTTRPRNGQNSLFLLVVPTS